MENENKTISIIIPAFNAQDVIETAIKSIENQKEISDKIEIVIVDDGSNDKTKEIVERLIIEQDYTNIRIFSRINKGVSSARNYGIKQAKGDYILFLDADDELKKDALSNLLSICKLKYDLILFNYEYFKDKKEKNNRVIYEINSSELDIKYLQNKVLLSSELNTVWQFCIYKKYLTKYNIKFKENIKVGEDLLFNLELFSYNPSLYYLNRVLYRYNYNNESVMNQNAIENIDKRLNDSTKVYYKLYDYIKIWNCDTSINRNYVAIKYFSLLHFEFDKIIGLEKIKLRKKIKFINKYISSKEANVARKNIKIRMIIFKDIMFLDLKLPHLYYFSRWIKNKIKNSKG